MAIATFSCTEVSIGADPHLVYLGGAAVRPWNSAELHQGRRWYLVFGFDKETVTTFVYSSASVGNFTSASVILGIVPVCKGTASRYHLDNHLDLVVPHAAIF